MHARLNSTAARIVSIEEIAATGGVGLDIGGDTNAVYVDSVSSTAGVAVQAFGGTSQLTARSITSSAIYGLHVEFTEDPVLLTVVGTNGLTLKDCVLLSNVTGTPAPASLDAPAAVDVRIYGSCMANVAKGANVTFLTGAARFEVDADVR